MIYIPNQFNCKGLLLMVIEMHFIHPKTGADVLITAAPNRAFSLILNQFNWKF